MNVRFTGLPGPLLNPAQANVEVEVARGSTVTCRSVRASEAAISMRLGRHRYLLKWNSFSSSNNCQQNNAILTTRQPSN